MNERMNESANVSKMPLCRLLYRSSAASELQLERTCNFVWGLPLLHSWQNESDVFLHLARFAAAGSCCCNAFRAKLYTGSCIIIRVFDQVMMFAFLTDSTTVLLRIPRHSREKNTFSRWCILLFLQVFTAWFRFELTIKSSSLGMFFAEVSDQSWIIVGGHLFLSHVVSVAI